MCTSALSAHQQDQERTTGQLLSIEQKWVSLSGASPSYTFIGAVPSSTFTYGAWSVAFLKGGTLMLGAATLIKDWALEGLCSTQECSF